MDAILDCGYRGRHLTIFRNGSGLSCSNCSCTLLILCLYSPVVFLTRYQKTTSESAPDWICLFFIIRSRCKLIERRTRRETHIFSVRNLDQVFYCHVTIGVTSRSPFKLNIKAIYPAHFWRIDWFCRWSGRAILLCLLP